MSGIDVEKMLNSIVKELKELNDRVKKLEEKNNGQGNSKESQN